MLNIRSAQLKDLDGIMAIERERFGTIDESAMATEATMSARIELCNSGTQPWFWVADEDGRILGYMVLQPTSIRPEECSSWNQATDNGSLSQTFNHNGENLYVVSLAVSQTAPEITSALLVKESFEAWRTSGKKHYMFCARMPGFSAAKAERGVTAEQYWRETDPSGLPTDWMLRLYQQMSGGTPLRLLLNGFPPDHESGGHGVLFAPSNADLALASINFILTGDVS